MSSVIKKFYLGNSKATIIANLPKAAELLGFSFNETDLIMYKGEDSTSGFKFDTTSSTTKLYFRFYYQNADTSSVTPEYTYSNGVSLFYYPYSDGTVIFGLSTFVTSLFCCYIPVVGLEDETISDWAYVFGAQNGNTDGFLIMCPTLWEGAAFKGQFYNNSFNVITLLPFIFEVANVGYFNIPKLSTVFTKEDTGYTQSLILNGEKYFTSKIFDDYTPFAFKIEE